MLFADNVTVHLSTKPDSVRIPFRLILDRWIAARFDPLKCRESLERIIAMNQLPAGLFRLEELERGGLAVAEQVLFPPNESWSLDFILGEPPAGASIGLGEEQVAPIAELLRWASHTDDAPLLKKRLRTLGPDRDWDDIVLAARPSRAEWPKLNGPGILRREHASLAICSSTTRILLDPICMVRTLPHISEAPAPDAEGWDAIVITHGHGDHWNLPSILSFAEHREIPVVVPRVPRTNILTRQSFEHSLKLAGQKVLAPEWNSIVRVGDIEIDVLPFYGEQPTRLAPGPAPELRNWGNCYRFNAPEFSAVVLVDGGADPAGDMEAVMKASYEKRGRADVVMSCLREFPSPFFGGLSKYWATLPFWRLKELFHQYEAGQLPFTTAGPSGAFELCNLVEAGHFLPYADGFEGVGRAISDVGWGMGEPSEDQMVDALQSRFAAARSGARALKWRPGDSAVFAGGKLSLVGCPG